LGFKGLNHAFCDIMWKNIAVPGGRPQITLDA